MGCTGNLALLHFDPNHGPPLHRHGTLGIMSHHDIGMCGIYDSFACDNLLSARKLSTIAPMEMLLTILSSLRGSSEPFLKNFNSVTVLTKISLPLFGTLSDVVRQAHSTRGVQISVSYMFSSVPFARDNKEHIIS